MPRAFLVKKLKLHVNSQQYQQKWGPSLDCSLSEADVRMAGQLCNKTALTTTTGVAAEATAATAMNTNEPPHSAMLLLSTIASSLSSASPSSGPLNLSQSAFSSGK